MTISYPRVLALAMSFICATLPSRNLVAQSPEPVVTSEERRVLAVEDEYVAAEISRDEASLNRLVDDRFALNTNRGAIIGKTELIRRVLAMNMVGQTITERSVLVEGNVALIFGTAELRFARADGPETVSTLRYTSTFVNRDGQWRMLALQMQDRAR